MHNKHLHPLAILMFIGEAVKNGWVTLVVFFLANRNPFLSVAIFLVLIALLAVIKYATFRYSILPNELFIRHGIIFKKQRHVPYDRIQTIQNRQWFFLRPFGVEEVVVNTAGSDDRKSQVKLPAVNTSIAPLIEKYHRNATGSEVPEEQTTEQELHSTQAKSGDQYRINGTDMFTFGLTDIHFFGEIFALVAILNELHLNVGSAINVYNNFATSIYRIVESIIFLVLLLMLVGLVKTFIKFYKFTLTKQGDHLVIEKGFFQRKTINLPINKIQAVIFKQNAVRQLFHLTTVQMDLVTNSGRDDEKSVVTVMPVVKDQQAFQVVNHFIDLIPNRQINFKAGDRYSQWLFARNGVFWVLVFLGSLTGVAFFTHFGSTWMVVLTVIIVVLAILNGIYKGRVTAVTQISADQIAVQTASLLTRETQIINWHQIQSINLRQSIWMVRSKRAHLSIDIRRGFKAEANDYRYLPEQQARAIFDWYRNFVK